MLFLTIHGSALAQGEYAVRVKSAVKRDRILLRWAPDKPMAWEYGNTYGYTVVRYTLVRDSTLLPQPIKTILTSQPLKPTSEIEWEKYLLATNDKYAAIAAQCIHGKSLELNTPNSSIFSMINKAKETENRFGFALFSADRSLKAAQFSALYFADSTIKRNEKYLYVVSSNVPRSVLKIDSGFTFVDAKILSESPKIRRLKATFGAKNVKLEWDISLIKDYYSAWQIERSADGKKWQNITEAPFSPLDNAIGNDEMASFIDTLPDNANTYHYRIAGLTVFGDIGPYSPVVKGKGKEPVPARPSISDLKMIDKVNLYVTWEFPAEYNGLITGFELALASKATGKYKSVGKYKTSVREAVMKAEHPSNYIVVRAFGKDSVVYASLPMLFALEDNTPPAVPKGLSGYIDTTGKVHLHWHPNKEADFYGYRLFVANSPNEEFSNTYPIIKDTAYVDSISLNNLSKFIYYKLQAMDGHYNPSAMTAHVKLRKPDKIAPSVPVISSLIASDTAIFIKWAPSNSNDVAFHTLYRLDSDSSEWVEMVRLPFSALASNQFIDKKVEKDRLYQYRLTATDEDGNTCEPSLLVKTKLVNNKTKPAITALQSKAEIENARIVINWKYPASPTLEKYLLFRGENNKPIKLYKSIEKDKLEFIDQNITINTTYSYRIRAQHTDGGSSPISGELKVKY